LSLFYLIKALSTVILPSPHIFLPFISLIAAWTDSCSANSMKPYLVINIIESILPNLPNFFSMSDLFYRPIPPRKI
jgi:hypothetical protein